MTDRTSSVEGWDTMEDANMVVTDIRVISKREKTQQDYIVVSDGPFSQR